ncbi:MAG: hypothetical protein IID34_03760 [Planctomycetes bacterium]|nr:hypothetical protein [Planctomycetota bacterium]
MLVGWDEYLKVSNACDTFHDCFRGCRSAFEQHRRDIRCAVEVTRPKTVACLGAGVLNDIPYEFMVQSGASIYLVDWVPGSIEAGVDLSIIRTGDDGKPSCIYCNPTIACPQTYCRHYQQASESKSTVCSNFVQVPGSPPRCAAFEKGEQPSVHYEDVTAGYSTEFGREILSELQHVRSWKQAFARAMALATRIGQHRTHTSIADSSVQLVTSSMVISQFDHEPYEYFARRAAEMLGPPTAKEEERLLPVMKALHEVLLRRQVERHCEEIRRILAPDGYCYMSFEMFHVVPAAAHWFLVERMAKALEIVGRHFLFNFDIIPHLQPMTHFQTGDTPSLTFSFMLTARQ